MEPSLLICPACFSARPADSGRCESCNEALWIDGRLALIEPCEVGVTRAFRGLLRKDGQTSTLTVTVKVLDVGGHKDWREVDRFRRQSEILAGLDHRGIPKPLGDFEVRGRLLCCQTFVEGSSLARKLRAARFAEAEIRPWVEELLAILEHVHGRRIVHRDVKPDNVIIDPTGRAHLVDFGAARPMDSTEQEPEPTVAGTPGFMPLEQARGEVRPQSDLFGLGKLALAALGDNAASPGFRRLLTRLTRDDWRARPATCAEARALLAPPASIRWPLVVGAALMLGVGVTLVGLGSRSKATAKAAAPPISEGDASSAGPDLDAEATTLLAEWAAAQNAGDFERYGRLYAESFEGVRRTPAGKKASFARDGWLKDRARMFTKPMTVAYERPEFARQSEDRVAVTFVQRFRSGKYAEHGTKMIVVEQKERPRIVGEEMIDSQRGWDEEEYLKLVPKAATCEVTLDLGAGSFWVTQARFDDYTEALRKAAALRKKKIPAEIAWGQDFANLDDGFWVVVGATNDQGEADEIARQRAGTVVNVEVDAERDRGALHLVASGDVNLSSFSSEKLSSSIVVAREHAFVLHGASVALHDLDGPGTAKKTDFALAKRGVRLALRDGLPHVLDQEGHWFRVGEDGVESARSFDPVDPDPIVRVKDWTAAISEGVLALHSDAGTSIQIGLGLSEARLKKGASAVALYGTGKRWVLARDADRGREDLFVLEMAAQRVRTVSKVCLQTNAADARIDRPFTVQIGEMPLLTDRKGALEIWTAQAGFVTLDSSDAKGALDCKDPDAELDDYDSIREAAIFDRQSVSLEINASCVVYGC